MLLSASQEARAGQDLAQIGLGRGRMAALSGGLLDDDERHSCCVSRGYTHGSYTKSIRRLRGRRSGARPRDAPNLPALEQIN